MRHVLFLAGQLHLNPDSRIRMIELGGDVRHIGWDRNAEIAADKYDQILSIVAGLGGKKLTESDRYPRPGTPNAAAQAKDEALFAPTIADFNVGAFMKEVAS